jgi:hypothetical protein
VLIFTVDKEGVLEWKPRKKKSDSLLLPKILVNEVEVPGLDEDGKRKVFVGDNVEIIDMATKTT